LALFRQGKPRAKGSFAQQKEKNIKTSVAATTPTGHSGLQEITVTPDGGRGPRLKYFSL